ncbi:MAG: 16S rRNA (cytosine(1402)-N(4))-methyltransferase RsmH [Capsulimonadaceae bacterium]
MDGDSAESARERSDGGGHDALRKESELFPNSYFLPSHANAYHLPVMIREVLEYLDPRPGEVFVDATVGGGGHSADILARIGPEGRLIGIDRDPEAIAEAARRLSVYAATVSLTHARFDSLARVLDEADITGVDGVLFDLGVSSHQLDTPSRGFSFKDPGAPLDMRMNPADAGETTAADLLNSLAERELATLLRENSDEHWALRIARFVVDRRRTEPISTVGQLVDIVHAAIPVAARPPDIHAATRTFQALRIAVNQELTVLGHALESAVDRLNRGGRLVVLSYHSIEDRIVKLNFARLAGRLGGEGPYGTRPPALIELLNKKPIGPGAAEVAANPRARSAKLRAVRKTV